MKSRTHTAPIVSRFTLKAGALCLVVLGQVAAGGCKNTEQSTTPERDPEVVTAAPVEVEATCHVVELDAMSEELTEVRERFQDKVRFDYGPSSRTVDGIVASAPDYVFLLAHGWMNDVLSSREFSSRLIAGIRERAMKDGVDPKKLAFIAVHWDSKRPVFHESALNAEVIGKRRVAPLLAKLKASCPQARLVLVGHSLGGRLCLSALNAAGTSRTAHSAVLLEAAADQDSLCPERASDMFGGFSLAPHGATLIANICSQQDDILRLAYFNAMRAPALGRDGVLRGVGEPYPKVTLVGTGLDAVLFDAALAMANSKADGGDGRVINVDASAVVSGHCEVFVAPVFDVIWRVASRPAS